MRKILAVGAAVLVAVSLAGCGASEPESAESGKQRTTETNYTFYQKLPNGERVLCVWAKDGYGGGLSCDWAGLHSTN